MPKQNKGFALILVVEIVLIVFVLTTGGVLVYQQNKVAKEEAKKTENNGQKPIGGAKDEYGCLIAAGYSWCEVKNKCLRTWEEKCEKEIVVKDGTADWKIYKNSEYGFEIKYPEDTKMGDFIDIEYNSAKSITFQLSSSNKVFEIKTYSQNPHCPDTTLGSSLSNVTINGVNFTKIAADRNYGINPPYAVALEYCVAHNGIEYKLIPRIYYPYDRNGVNFVLPDVNSDPILNQMLSTFKFTK